MNIFPKQSLEYAVIGHLQKRSWVIVDLIEELKKSRPKLSKQAVYQILRHLKKSDIVVVANKRVSLSSIWIDRMHEFFTTARIAYEGIAGSSEQFMNLAEGDRIVYEFKDLKTADTFWGHAFSLFKNILQPGSPILIYNAHQWFILARPESELHLIKQAETNGHPIFTYISSKTPLDTYTKQFFRSPNSCYLGDISYFKPNVYVNVFDDLVIESSIDPAIQARVDAIFEKEKTWNTSVQQELISLITLQGRNKIIISRNNKKAEKYKKIFKKYFILK